MGLTLVELFDAHLEVGEGFEGGGEGWREFDAREGVEGRGKVSGRFGEVATLLDDCVEGFHEAFELSFEEVEVGAAIMEPLGCVSNSSSEGNVGMGRLPHRSR